jgi:hypothetical protein
MPTLRQILCEKDETADSLLLRILRSPPDSHFSPSEATREEASEATRKSQAIGYGVAAKEDISALERVGPLQRTYDHQELAYTGRAEKRTHPTGTLGEFQMLARHMRTHYFQHR